MQNLRPLKDIPVGRKRGPMSLKAILDLILREPTPAALWALQGELLVREGSASEEETPALRRAQEVATEFYLYLSELQSKTSARTFSELASLLDIGAVGAVALENVIAERENILEKLLLGGLGESLMVLASRQYIKAWEVESGLVHRRAAWYLLEALWRMSAENQPALPPTERKDRVQALLAPGLDGDTPAALKVVLLVRLFQVLLLIHLSQLE
jgi:hypothetical protein